MSGTGGKLQMVIKVLNGEFEGTEFPLPTKMTIGNSPSKADICIPHDKLMMDRHARITLEDGEYWLEDLGSTSGTFVDGQKIAKKVRLQKGSKFQLGGTSFKFKKVRSELGYLIEKPHWTI